MCTCTVHLCVLVHLCDMCTDPCVHLDVYTGKWSKDMNIDGSAGPHTLFYCLSSQNIRMCMYIVFSFINIGPH